MISMPLYELKRDIVNDRRGSISEFKLGLHKLYVLERPYIDNIPNISSAAPGIYTCNKFISKRHGETFRLLKTSGRTGILLGHKGNWIRDSLGCMIIGMEYEDVAGKELSVGKSRIAMKIFRRWFKSTPRFKVQIHAGK